MSCSQSQALKRYLFRADDVYSKTLFYLQNLGFSGKLMEQVKFVDLKFPSGPFKTRINECR